MEEIGKEPEKRNPWDGVIPPWSEQAIQKTARMNITWGIIGVVVWIAGMLASLITVIPILWVVVAITHFGDDPRTAFLILIAAGLFLIGLPIVSFNGIKNGQGWLRDPHSHPVLVWSRLGTTHAVAALLDYEMANTDQHAKLHGVLFTPSWLLLNSHINHAFPLSEIAWVYTKITQRRQGLIPVSKEYALLVYARNGRLITIPCGSLSPTIIGKSVNVPEQKTQELTQELMRRAPGALYGYSAKLQQVWEKQRDLVVAKVDERQAAHAASLEGSPEPRSGDTIDPDFGDLSPDDVEKRNSGGYAGIGDDIRSVAKAVQKPKR